MANVVFTEVFIEGDRRELWSLYGKMRRLERRARPLVDNNFYHPNRWLGCLVTRMGHDWHDVYCRGTWDFLQMRGGLLSFDTETAWDAPLELLELIRETYPSLRVYYSAEGEGWDCYLTNDAEGRHFTSRYVVDMEPDIEYFDTLEEVSRHLLPVLGRPVTSREELFQALEDWEERNTDPGRYVNVKEIVVE